MKKYGMIFIFIITSFAAVLLDQKKWIITDNFLLEGLFNFLIMLMVLLILISLLIWGIIYFKTNKIVSSIMVLISVTAMLWQNYLPYNTAYLKLYYEINKNSMHEIAEMFETGEMNEYQIGDRKFLLPEKANIIFDTGFVLKNYYSTNDICFYVSSGIFGESAILYLPDNSKSPDETINKIVELDKNWYAIIQY